MIENTSFFPAPNFQSFSPRLDAEIHRIFSHLNGRKNAEFPFRTRDQMNQQTEKRAELVREMLGLIDQQAAEMGEAYGDAFRFVMYRDLYDRLKVYAAHVQKHIPHSSRIPEFAM